MIDVGAILHQDCKSQLTHIQIRDITKATSGEEAHLKLPPSYFLALVKTTVLAGMLSPVEKVSVAKSTCHRPHICRAHAVDPCKQHVGLGGSKQHSKHVQP